MIFSDQSIADRVNSYFSSQTGDIRYIFSPFIQRETIERVVPDDGNDTIVVTRWRRDDIASGVSDPDVYKFCRERGYTLKCNSRLHAKVYSWDLDNALLGSANLTDAGMCGRQEDNIEVLTSPIELRPETQLKLRQAESQSQLVTEAGYEKAVEISEKTESNSMADGGSIEMEREPDFLTSQLPTTDDPDTIVSVLAEDRDCTLEDLSAPLRRCVLHDISSLSLEGLEGYPEEKVKDKMRQQFENHPFIREIISNMDPHIYFGEMKELVQRECVDVPTPSRRELTEDIQILYSWFHKVSQDRFKMDVPGVKSQRLTDTYSTKFEN